MEIDVSIVIVNYKTPDLLKECVASIIEHTEKITFEIVVVDNHSEDESEQIIKGLFPNVKWINSGYNAGFARANNIGIKNATGKYILLLNSDTIVNKHTLLNTYNDYIALEKTNQKIGFLGCQLIDLNGNIQFNSRPKVKNLRKILLAHPIVILLFRLLRIKEEDQHKTFVEMEALHKTFHETKWLGGTYLFYNKNISHREGLYLDEDFFMYGEDTEWSLRLIKKGYKHFFTPNASVIHAEGGSFKVKAPKWIQISLSEWLFILKIYGRFTFFFMALINLTGIQLDNFFTKRIIKNKPERVNDEMLAQYQIRKEVEKILKKSFFKVLFNYKRKTSSAANYLKIIP
jgi:GT2 family glycosyltransferase